MIIRYKVENKLCKKKKKIGFYQKTREITNMINLDIDCIGASNNSGKAKVSKKIRPLFDTP